MSSTFFVSWELWQQMTFVLASAIVAVFFIGWIRLLWTNRYFKRQEEIRQERRARRKALRNAGLPLSTQSMEDIPFGVRALQNGVEVDGIWISKPFPNGPGSIRRKSTNLSRKESVKRALEAQQALQEGNQHQQQLAEKPYTDARRPSEDQNVSRGVSAGRYQPYRAGHEAPTTTATTTTTITTTTRQGDTQSGQRAAAVSSHPQYDNDDRTSLTSSTEYGTPETSHAVPYVSGDTSHQMQYATAADGRDRTNSGGGDDGTSRFPSNHFFFHPGSPPQGFRDQYYPSSLSSSSRPASPTNEQHRDEEAAVGGPYVGKSSNTAAANNRTGAARASAVRGFAHSAAAAEDDNNRGIGSGQVVHANTTRRGVNSGFELLPAGTFGVTQQEQHEESENQAGRVERLSGWGNEAGQRASRSKWAASAPANKLQKKPPSREGAA